MSSKTKELIFSKFLNGESVNSLAVQYDLTISDVENIIRSQVMAINKAVKAEREYRQK
jgi:Mor family transcriptional regulator